MLGHLTAKQQGLEQSSFCVCYIVPAVCSSRGMSVSWNHLPCAAPGFPQA